MVEVPPARKLSDDELREGLIDSIARHPELLEAVEARFSLVERLTVVRAS